MDTIKGVAELTREINDLELKRKIIDLQSEVFTLIEENNRLKEEIQQVINAQQINKKLIFKDNGYYHRVDGEEIGPYCTACWDLYKRLIRLHVGDFYQECPVCSKGLGLR